MLPSRSRLRLCRGPRRLRSQLPRPEPLLPAPFANPELGDGPTGHAFAGRKFFGNVIGKPGVGFASAAGVAAAQPRGKSRWPIFAVAALVVLAAAGFAAWRFWPRTRPFADVSISQVTNAGTIERIALSADGRFLAEVKNDGGQRTLWVRNTATNTDTQIQGAFGNDYLGLAFSPDGNYLYFTRGTPENDSLRALYVMPVFGGTPKQLIVDIDSVISFSPDGNRFAYTKWTPDRKDQYSEIHIADKDGSNNQLVYTTLQEAGPPVWSPDGGRLAWIGTAGAAAKYALQLFDLSTKKVTTIMPPADNRFQNSAAGETNLVWTPDGAHLLLFYLKPHTDHAQIGMIAVPSGEFHPVTNDVNSYSQLALSADGRTLATVLTEIASSIAYYKPEGGAPLSITPLRITPNHIVWANEDRLLFSVPRIAIGSMDRTTGNTQNFDAGEIDLGRNISRCPDGHILFTGFPKGAAQARVFRMDADGGNIVQLTTSGIARNPQCSADSQQVYYSDAESGVYTASLWVVPLAGGTPRQLLPPEATGYFDISRDGRLASCGTVAQTGRSLEDIRPGHRPALFPTSLWMPATLTTPPFTFRPTAGRLSKAFFGAEAGRCCISRLTDRPRIR